MADRMGFIDDIQSQFISITTKMFEIAKEKDVQIAIVACDDIGYTPEELASVIDILNRVLVPQDIYLMC